MAQEVNLDKPRPLIVRPTFIIGIGGTGCLAVKNVKRCFLDQLGRADVPFVKFLVIDTTTEEPYGLKLNDGEFINLGGIDVNEIIDNIELYPHLQAWFPSKQIRPMQTGLGAGGVRHIGRLYYFQWRESTQVMGKIQNLIELLMNPRVPDRAHQVEELRNLSVTVDMNHGIDIHIIGGVAGGTAAGILLDLAYDLRGWCKKGAGSSTITAHLVLPEAFMSKVPRMLHEQLQINAYTCLSEINHFIHHGGWQVRYQKEEIVEETRPPFDYIFLLNGQLEVGLRDHYELTSVIGKTIATLVITPLGSVILQKAINISQNVLGHTDGQYNEPLAYSSYSLATAVLDKDRLLNATEWYIAQEIISKALSESKQIEKEMGEFTDQHGVSLEKLHYLLPGIEEIRWTDKARDDDKFAAFDLEDYRRKTAQDQQRERQRWQEKLNQTFSQDLDDSLHSKLSGLWSEKKSLNYLLDFVKAFLLCLEQLKIEAQSKRQELDRQKEKSQSDIQSIPRPYGQLGLERYAKLLLDVERAECHRPFWEAIIDQIEKATNRIRERFQKKLDLALNACRSHRKRIANLKLGMANLPPESFEFHSCEEVAKTIMQNHLDSCVQKFGHGIMRILNDPTTKLASDLQEELEDLPSEIAREMALQILKDYEIQRGLDIHKLAEILDESDLKRKLKELIGASRPSVRLVGHFPISEKQEINYVGANVKGDSFASADLNGSLIFRSIQALDVNFQAAPHNSCEVPIIAFLYGFPLWALLPASSWKGAFDRRLKDHAQVFLAPSWQKEIRSFLDILDIEEERKRLSI